MSGKLLGQIRLVLLGRSLISAGGSFTLMSGYVLDDPLPEATSFAVAVEGFVRATLSLRRDLRINAVSPGLAEDSRDQVGPFNPGGSPSPWAPSARPSSAAWRGGERARSSGRGDHPGAQTVNLASSNR